MVESKLSQKFKMAAIDLDGTLLGPEGTISAANREAVARLQGAGVQVVLASGRHYKSLRRYAYDLPSLQWIISCQGGEVSDLSRTTVLDTQFMPRPQVAATLQSGRSLGLTPVAYGVEDIYTVSDWDADLEFYSHFAAYRPIRCPLDELLGRPIFKVIWVGSPDQIERAKQQVPANSDGCQMVQTNARFLEFMPPGVSKAVALKLLAERLGVQASEVIAFGDGDNDVPMFRWAGVSVAMPHGWPAALQSATYTGPTGPADTALARAIDLLFERRLLTGPPASKDLDNAVNPDQEPAR